METSHLQQFGYVRRGDELVMPRPRFFTGMMYGAALVLLAFGLVMSVVALGQQRQGIGSRGGDLGAGLVIIALALGGGVLFLLYAVRFRQAIDLRQRAFVTQGAFGRDVLPFAQVADIRPVNLTVNGAYQGLHYEAFSTAKPYQPGQRGLKISPSFQDEGAAAGFQQALYQLLD